MSKPIKVSLRGIAEANNSGVQFQGTAGANATDVWLGLVSIALSDFLAVLPFNIEDVGISALGPIG